MYREQALQTVVAVDDTAVEVVEVGGGVAASFESDHGTQGRRNDGKTRHKHPLGADACALEGFRERQALAELVAVGGA